MEELKRYIIELKAEVIANSSKLSRVSDDVGLMRTTIVGIPETNRPGMIHDIAGMKERVDGHDKDIKNLKEKNFKEKVYIGAGAAGAGATIAAATHTSFADKIVAALGSLFKF